MPSLGRGFSPPVPGGMVEGFSSPGGGNGSFAGSIGWTESTRGGSTSTPPVTPLGISFATSRAGLGGGGGTAVPERAIRLATVSSHLGRRSFGASTTTLTGEGPLATRMVCRGWNASLPPDRPERPACAPPASSIRGRLAAL